MVEKFGSDQSQLAIFGGGVITEDGAVLVSGESAGKDSLLFGPAALREIQSGIANSDFAVPPADIASNIDDSSNPLPYWSVTAGSGWSAVSVAADDFIVGGSGSGRSVRVVCAASTPLDRQISLTRITPIASNVNRAHSYYPEVYVAAGATSTTIGISLTTSYLDSTFTTISSGPSRTSTTVGVGLYAPTAQNVNMAAPSNAAYIQLTIAFVVNAVGGSGGSEQGFTISECRLVRGDEALLVSELTTPATYAPAILQQKNGVLTIEPASSVQINGTLIGDGVTTDLKHGITLQRTTNLTVNTSVDASATAITWSSAVKNTSLYAYWSSGSTIAIPLTGWYSITCHLISGTGLGTGFAFRLYALVNGTVIAETETQAGANTTSDTFAISTIAYMTAADSLVFRASASAASKTIGGSRRSACSVVYLGNTSA